MEVRHSKTFSNIPNYSIEWGNATWTEEEDIEDKDRSIRNRYNKADGGYNHVGSKEIPWSDFNRMITESIKEREFSNKELIRIYKMSLSTFLKNILNL